MNAKRLNIGLLIASAIGFGLGLAFKSSIELSLCLVTEPTCINNFTWIGNALFYGSGALALVFLILLFTPSAFPAWKKFAIWFVPIAAILFAMYPDPGSGDYFSPYPEQVFQWVSILYVIISAVIIFRSTPSKDKRP